MNERTKDFWKDSFAYYLLSEKATQNRSKVTLFVKISRERLPTSFPSNFLGTYKDCSYFSKISPMAVQSSFYKNGMVLCFESCLIHSPALEESVTKAAMCQLAIFLMQIQDHWRYEAAQLYKPFAYPGFNFKILLIKKTCNNHIYFYYLSLQLSFL